MEMAGMIHGPVSDPAASTRQGPMFLEVPMTATNIKVIEPVGVKSRTSVAAAQPSGDLAALAGQYGCGPIAFSGADNALYDRHLLFDNVVDLNAAGMRE